MDKKSDILIKCKECGAEFTFTVNEQNYFEQKNFTAPKRCKNCRNAHRKMIEALEQEKLHKIWAAQEYEKIKKLLNTLPYSKLTPLDIKIVNSSSTLFIIGNGFDIMHGVPSKYSDFRDSMGKRNHLRCTLETYIKSDSLWCDFEEALAHIDGATLLGNVDMWMDIMGAYEPDALAADFCAAYEYATEPAQEITMELPRKFRKWVETLEPTKSSFLRELLLDDATYLNFNYTEFLETMYSVPSSKITYIHGCRKNKKQELILGHTPGVGDEDDWSPSIPYPNYKSAFKMELLSGAIEGATRNLTWYDEETTKKTDEIIANHHTFFASLLHIENIVVIGHSLSSVDYPYFKEIIKNTNNANWIISWFSSRDLENINTFSQEMGIKKSKISIFK